VVLVCSVEGRLVLVFFSFFFSFKLKLVVILFVGV